MSSLFANSQATTVTTSAAEATIVTADPNTENLLTGLVVSCITAGAVGTLTLRDATGAPVAKAVIDFPTTAAVPALPFVLAFNPPLKQSTKNTAWTIQSSSAANSFKVNATFITEE